jgi:oxygen-independent coproporphyrinogen-3 oxidase
MLENMRKNNFEQYEISNFCKDNFYSKHNSNYWLKQPYLGLGPSAHSFNGTSRKWNVSNNALYIQSFATQVGSATAPPLGGGGLETLTTSQQYNEYILTTLRTIWGSNLTSIKTDFGNDYLIYCLKEAEKYILSEDIKKENNKLFLTDKGKLIADKIASDLFMVE